MKIANKIIFNLLDFKNDHEPVCSTKFKVLGVTISIEES